MSAGIITQERNLRTWERAALGLGSRAGGRGDTECTRGRPGFRQKHLGAGGTDAESLRTFSSDCFHVLSDVANKGRGWERRCWVCRKGERSHFGEWGTKSAKDRKDAYVLALRTWLRARYQGGGDQSEGLLQLLLIRYINFCQQEQIQTRPRDVMK